MSDRGEEAGILAERLVELKNHLLDQSIFESSYHVVRIDRQKQEQMVLAFVRDMSKQGEYFLSVSVPGEGVRKLVPIMAVAWLDSRDNNLTFGVQLTEECSDICFDESFTNGVAPQI